MRLLATGASNQEIAQTRVIELPTVKKHVSSLLGKLRASSRTQAISRACALSLGMQKLFWLADARKAGHIFA